ncbi:PREDICTED: uncharacterized protein LOC104699219 [Camelina sativa]|uniref:Uncharacterized protein LOC104699219 n=1 Tax=Camelina sativa TaxID=90675 RepID=A0ABM0SL85_CAMSA|nr:PREDICTED: uncharacterized protein LOC104699219 [Camelina sativa]
MYEPSMYPTQGYLQFNDGHIYNMACLSLSEFTQNTSNTFSMYEPSMYPTQGNLQFNDGQIYNMAQGFINPYMTIEPQWMDAQQQLHLNDGCVIHDSYDNATFISPTVPSTVDSHHQDTFNNAFLFSTTPPSIPAHVPHPTYSSYPPYNTLEVVEAQLNALQESRENQTQETLPRETNLSSSVTRDEVDPVDKYIDWAKVEERDIDELDPVEVLEALGFGVSP